MGCVGVYGRPLLARSPAPMWGRAARSASASASAPMSFSAEPADRSPCSRFRWKGRWGLSCLSAFPVYAHTGAMNGSARPAVIRGRPMKITTHVWQDSRSALAGGPVGRRRLGTERIAKTIKEKLTAKMAKLERAWRRTSKNIVAMSRREKGVRILHAGPRGQDQPEVRLRTGGGRSQNVKFRGQLKDAIVACKAEISGVCGKTVPGQGRIAACLITSRRRPMVARTRCRKSKRWWRNSRRQAPAVDCDCSQTPDHAMRVSFTQLPLLRGRCRIRSEKCPQRKNEAGPLIELRHS